MRGDRDRRYQESTLDCSLALRWKRECTSTNSKIGDESRQSTRMVDV